MSTQEKEALTPRQEEILSWLEGFIRDHACRRRFGISDSRSGSGALTRLPDEGHHCSWTVSVARLSENHEFLDDLPSASPQPRKVYSRADPPAALRTEVPEKRKRRFTRLALYE